MVRSVVTIDDFFDKLPPSELDIAYKEADAKFQALQSRIALCNGATTWVNENWEAACVVAERWGLTPQDFMEEMLIRAFEIYRKGKHQ